MLSDDDCRTISYYALFSLELANPDYYLPFVFDLQRSAREMTLIMLRSAFAANVCGMDDDAALDFAERQILPLAKAMARL